MPGLQGPVLIAGGGIGGISAGLALARRGFDVRIFEKTPEIREVGAGIQISPNGMRVLYELGLEAPINATACRTDRKIVGLGLTGEMFEQYFNGPEILEQYGYPYSTIHRADLFQALLDGLRQTDPDALRLGSEVVAAAQSEDGVTLTLADGTTAEGAVLIAADGVHSRIRDSLIGDGRPSFTGILAWRGVLPMERVPEHMRTADALNWIGPFGHIVNYPLRGGELMNIASYIERDDWQVESWTESGSHEEYLNDFATWHEDIHALIRGVIEPFKWALLVREPLESWTTGRITLLGDAAHPTLPFLAQGANMTLEDSFVLARALEAYGDSPAEALLRYEAARRERANLMVTRSAANTARYHNATLADPAVARRYVETEFTRERVTQNYEWLYGYDVTQVPV